MVMLPEESCLYAALDSPPESHDMLLREMIAPVVEEIRGHADLDSLFFVRFAEPGWQLRFRVMGRPGWVEGTVRPRVEAMIRPYVASGTIGRVEYGVYAREWERYGGPDGMRLAEKIFTEDSLACLALLAAEREGRLARTRREYSLAFTELFLDLAGFGAAERLQLYRDGHAWAFRDGVFRDEDRPRLDRQYAQNRESLRAVVRDLRSGATARALGGEEAARIAEGALAAARPHVAAVAAGIDAGTIPRKLVDLAWSYTHLHCNRLGIDVVPEAILRYLMFRLYEEDGGASLPS
jgi:thiopeptide-type bacteriocin biosynthesis protein